MPDYPVLTAILRDGKTYRSGDTLTLEPEDARPLLRDGALADVEAETLADEADAAAKSPKRGKADKAPAPATGPATTATSGEHA
jgi:hypothetical protein